MVRTSYICDDDDDDYVRFVLNQYAEINVQSACRHATPLESIMIYCQPMCRMLNGELTSSKYQWYSIWFDPTRPVLEPTINHTQAKIAIYYTTDPVT